MTQGHLRLVALALVLVLAEAVVAFGETKAEMMKQEQESVVAITKMETFVRINVLSLIKMKTYLSAFKKAREDSGCCEEVREQEVNEFSKLEKGFDFATTSIHKLEEALSSFINHIESYYCATCPPNPGNPCLMSERRCGSGECVPRGSLCDGTRNCEDGSDEDPTVCVKSCQDDEYRCQVENRCLPASYRCDGMTDCGHGDDEASCNPATPPTPSTTAPSTYHSTPSTAPPLECTLEEFRCQSGKRCIDKSYRCDGDDDCRDGSDEFECGDCAANQFRCHTSKCIHQSFQCDGENDCGDNSDEDGCEIVCNSNQFLCEADNRCIREAWVCDGDQDCDDGTDEYGCNDPLHFPRQNCEGDDFLCGTRNKCIPRSWLCNGRTECPDGSDEVNCTAPVPGTAQPSGTAPPPSTAPPSGTAPPPSNAPHTGSCEDGQYLCGSGECITYHWLCDGDPDCKDSGDEQDCELCTTHTCSHSCFPSSTDSRGYICTCPVGYVLTKDRRTCVPCDTAVPNVEAEVEWVKGGVKG